VTATVSLNNVSKSYDEGESRHQVLKNLDFQAERGEAVALLGSSGSGKSTLLNLISGLSLPDSGSVLVAGQALERMDEHARTLFRRRNIGFVFQFFHLVPTLTVEENLRLPLQLNGMEGPTELASLSEMLARVRLSGRARQLPDRLSGGEQQRVAVCRALIHRPPVLLADEPTGNLDGDSAEEVLALLFELCRQAGSTMLLVTHSMHVAGRCDRVLRLQGGRLAPPDPA
jgi:putative ABC transport system ATP-binding protein